FLQRYDEVYEIQDDYGFGGHSDLALAKELGLDSKWHHGAGYSAPPGEMPEIPNELQERFKGMTISHDGHVSLNGWYQDGVLKTPELIKDWISYIKTFEISPDEYFKHFKHVWENGLERDMVPIPTAGGPTYSAWAAIGMADGRLAYIMRKHPVAFKRLVEAFGDLAVRIHDRLFEIGVDMVFICDDHCYKDRCMFKPSQFDELLVPNFKKMAGNAHKHGAKFFVHSDGFLEEEIPLLIKAGVDAAEPLEYEANNRLGRLKKAYGKKISLIGNVPASDILSYGTVEETIEITKKCILDAAEGGGYVLAPGSDVLGTIKIENFKAMVETVKKYGKYPIDKSKLE
ncbi:MAG: uroporphyrinogen decarboxylase family protein, partial [Promethearchaeota archaeon]